ncbi:hypothetical protein PoB_003493800 [Plakobranchus ocellatus]|uniref:Uncharacterized protein n=1 Tax=Plakobranchus ocellatus TaxID=259542 RepID=A0AAV4ANS6_9GAST|nr:hypothetical protein PoB_003493800 [Plakobranchus ocellatus]
MSDPNVSTLFDQWSEPADRALLRRVPGLVSHGCWLYSLSQVRQTTTDLAVDLCIQQCDLSGHPSGQSTVCGARTRDRGVPADLRMNLLFTFATDASSD